MRSGFVYLWKDTKRNKFYLGSHLGTPNDGYVGSNKQFLNTYKSRPDTFGRRILEIYESCTNNFIRDREQKWLSLIKVSELTKRYYNIKNVASGGDIYSCLSEDQKRLARLKGNSKIRKLLITGIDIDSAEKLLEEERIRTRLSKKKPGETWTGRKHRQESRDKQSAYRKENPSIRINFNHSEETKFLVKINNPKRKSIKTPFGNFYSAEDFCKSHPKITPNGLRLLFKDLDLPITQKRAERCPLLSIDDIGKTMRSLGYSYTEDINVNQPR